MLSVLLLQPGRLGAYLLLLQQLLPFRPPGMLQAQQVVAGKARWRDPWPRPGPPLGLDPLGLEKLKERQAPLQLPVLLRRT